MNPALYRLETRRVTRTYALHGLLAFYALFGALSPVLVLTLPDLIRAMEGMEGVPPGLAETLPPVSPEPVVATFVENTQALGTLLVVLVATSALTLDHSPGRSVFYRTRAPGMVALILPRFVVTALAATAAYVVGALLAWAVTLPLLGPLPFGPVVVGALLGGLFLVFAVALVALVAGRVRNVLAVAGLSASALVLLSILGMLPVVGQWSPTALFTGQAAIAAGESLTQHVRSVVSTLVGTVVLLVLAVRGFAAREV